MVNCHAVMISGGGGRNWSYDLEIAYHSPHPNPHAVGSGSSGHVGEYRLGEKIT